MMGRRSQELRTGLSFNERVERAKQRGFAYRLRKWIPRSKRGKANNSRSGQNRETWRQ